MDRRAVLVLLAFCAATALGYRESCGIAPTEPVHPNNPVPIPALSPANGKLPLNFDWRDEAPLSDVLNQRNPVWCGSCWAMATASSLTDRFRIAFPKDFRFRRLAPQALLNCGAEYGVGTCMGGQWEKAHQFAVDMGLVDETCLPFMGLDKSYNAQVPCAERMCRECDLNGNCARMPNPQKYFLSSWGKVNGSQAMMEEIHARGPITCYIYSHVEAFSKYTGGIIIDRTPFKPGNITHVVSLVGWGEQRSSATGEIVPYWIGKNSAGTRFGEEGWFRLLRGFNSLNIEWNCGFGIPARPKKPSEAKSEAWFKMDL